MLKIVIWCWQMDIGMNYLLHCGWRTRPGFGFPKHRLHLFKFKPSSADSGKACFGKENTWTSSTRSGKVRNSWRSTSESLLHCSLSLLSFSCSLCFFFTPRKMDGLTDVYDRLINLSGFELWCQHWTWPQERDISPLNPHPPAPKSTELLREKRIWISHYYLNISLEKQPLHQCVISCL